MCISTGRITAIGLAVEHEVRHLVIAGWGPCKTGKADVVPSIGSGQNSASSALANRGSWQIEGAGYAAHCYGDREISGVGSIGGCHCGYYLNSVHIRSNDAGGHVVVLKHHAGNNRLGIHVYCVAVSTIGEGNITGCTGCGAGVAGCIAGNCGCEYLSVQTCVVQEEVGEGMAHGCRKTGCNGCSVGCKGNSGSSKGHHYSGGSLVIGQIPS